MMKEQEMNVDKYDIPLWRKYTLSCRKHPNYPPYKNGKYKIESEPSLWYYRDIIAWLFSMTGRRLFNGESQ